MGGYSTCTAPPRFDGEKLSGFSGKFTEAPRGNSPKPFISMTKYQRTPDKTTHYCGDAPLTVPIITNAFGNGSINGDGNEQERR
jgi:hypothetical protein